jgi:hypothetical protein
MQVQVDIDFEDLLKIVKTLPPSKIKLLKEELQNKSRAKKSKPDLEALLLKGPVATKKQLALLERNRKAINQWRKNTF